MFYGAINGNSVLHAEIYPNIIHYRKTNDGVSVLVKTPDKEYVNDGIMDGLQNSEIKEERLLNLLNKVDFSDIKPEKNFKLY